MRISPPAQLAARSIRAEPGFERGELLLRYAAAYSCTLIAIAAAQLYVPNAFALLLAAVTLAGLPISLYLRWSNLRFFGRHIPRFLINSLIVVLTGIACLCFLLLTQSDLLSGSIYRTVVIVHSAGDSIAVLMSLFLIFAVVRSLAIINDKDAVLSSVSSFSVLLLLIPVHRGPAVVVYFLLWALFSALLFALDHRQESRQVVGGIVPSLEPGVDIKLSARGLMTVMSFSLVCAVGVSYWLSNRHPEDRGLVEGWILGLAGRMTQLALNLPDVSVNSGPERQIDFTSGPALPTRTTLWIVSARTLDAESLEWQPVQPAYWRMFTLSLYNGTAWSQTYGQGAAIRRSTLTQQDWPLVSPMGFGRYSSDNRRRNEPSLWQRSGYKIVENHPHGQKILHSFGKPAKLIVQSVEPRIANIGFVPMLPAPRALLMRTEKPLDAIRVREDVSAVLGVLQPGIRVSILSSVSPGEFYGAASTAIQTPTRKNQRLNRKAALSSTERRLNLELPHRLRAPGSRVRWLAAEILREAGPNESNYQRARRLALALQERAIYTLRPPAIPANTDAAEYFLFESRRGYCTYFAGALTVLCRASGIPARVVSGFVNPEWTADGQFGIVREANAHAWTEIWVEGWGWTAIDATPPDNRGNNASGWWENWMDLIGASLESFKQWFRQNAHFIRWGMLALIPALLLIAARRGMTDPLLARLQKASQGRVKLSPDQSRRVIFKAYERAERKLARRFRHRTGWETPSEWLTAAEAALGLENPRPLRELTRLYLQAKYSPRAISNADGAAAYEATRQLSWKTRKP